MTSENPTSTKHKSKTTFWVFLLIFFSIGLLLTGVIATIYGLGKKEYLEEVMAHEKFNLDLQKATIANIFETIYADLIFLSRQNELLLLLETNNSNYRKMINQEYLEFCKQKRMYDQVRFIDSNGMEICRINFNNGMPESVPSSELQSKRNRYYFTDTFKLSPNKIFVSPFDLNIEKGTIEKPLKPMIRFGTPVFDNARQKRGIIILNYLGSKLIQNIKETSQLSEGTIMLVNSEGYWLIGANPEDEWGFMFDGKKNQKFKSAFPDRWLMISAEDSFQLHDKDGLFTFTTIYPLSREIRSSTGATDAFGKSEKYINAGEYYWKLVSFISSDVLHSKTNGLLARLVFLGTLLFFFSSIPSYFAAQGIVRRKLHQSELVHLATFDQLTGLPNRFLFFDRLDQSLKQASRYKRQFALLFIDLDGFKTVNDSLGHDAGDNLLVQTAKRLASAVRKADTVARLAGDEFTIILTDIQSQTDPEMFAQKILKELAVPFTVGENKIKITAIIGIGIFSVGEETAETLLKKSDSAMYEAKRHGKNTYKVFG
ncbi:MAG: GGDEF domain-containing protein [Deltaproteobacteria bacterium]|nr:GGDEF domain-containing protein [Deltaproteobacteria bacterium]